MKIQFEIKEHLEQIIDELFSSDKWKVEVIEKHEPFQRLILMDLMYDSNATVEIWEHEIHITTAWSNYTYRIFKDGKRIICEYIGAYRGLLEQNLLPTLTPVENILDSVVIQTTINNMNKESLREYGKEKGRASYSGKQALNLHPTIVQDEFIKEGVPIPTPSK